MFTDKKILAIDDATSIRIFLRISMESHGAAFFEAGTAAEGIRLCQEVQPDLVVLDLGLPDGEGLDILPIIKQSGIKHSEGIKIPRVIVLTVRKENETKEKAFKLGADAYVTKPFMVDELMEMIEAQIMPK